MYQVLVKEPTLVGLVSGVGLPWGWEKLLGRELTQGEENTEQVEDHVCHGVLS